MPGADRPCRSSGRRSMPSIAWLVGTGVKSPPSVPLVCFIGTTTALVKQLSSGKSRAAPAQLCDCWDNCRKLQHSHDVGLSDGPAHVRKVTLLRRRRFEGVEESIRAQPLNAQGSTELGSSSSPVRRKPNPPTEAARRTAASSTFTREGKIDGEVHDEGPGRAAQP